MVSIDLWKQGDRIKRRTVGLKEDLEHFLMKLFLAIFWINFLLALLGWCFLLRYKCISYEVRYQVNTDTNVYGLGLTGWNIWSRIVLTGGRSLQKAAAYNHYFHNHEIHSHHTILSTNTTIERWVQQKKCQILVCIHFGNESCKKSCIFKMSHMNKLTVFTVNEASKTWKK